MKSDDRPIGIFDSGVGGLTVMDSVTKLLPSENVIYFGDTARFPYGPRPIEEIRSFAFQIMDLMVSYDVKMLVAACNSMTAATYPMDSYKAIPLIGVIEPAVRAAVRGTHNRKIGVLGTRATIASGQYERSLRETRQNVDIFTVICPGFVDHVESGDTFSEELHSMAEEYLAPLLASGVDALILGCTHYPLLKGVLHAVSRGQTELISSDEEVAKDVYARLVDLDLLRRVREVGYRRYIVSGDSAKFQRVGSRFIAGIDEVEAAGWPAAEVGSA